MEGRPRTARIPRPKAPLPARPATGLDRRTRLPSGPRPARRWGSSMEAGTPPLTRSQVKALPGPSAERELCRRDSVVRNAWQEPFTASRQLQGRSLEAEAQECSLEIHKLCHQLDPDDTVYGAVLRKVITRYDRVVSELVSQTEKAGLGALKAAHTIQELRGRNTELQAQAQAEHPDEEHARCPGLPGGSALDTLKIAGLKGRLRRQSEVISEQDIQSRQSEEEEAREREEAAERYALMEDHLRAAEEDVAEAEKIGDNMQVMMRVLPSLLVAPEEPLPAPMESKCIQVDVDDGTEAELAGLREQMRTAAAANNQLRAKCASLQTEVVKHQQPPSEKADNKDLINQMQQLRFLNDRLSEQVRKTNEMVNKLEKKNGQLSKQNTELTVTGDRSSAQLRIQLELAQAEQARALARGAQLEAQLQSQHQRFEQFNKSNKSSDAERQSLSGTVLELEHRCVAEQQRVHQLQSELEQLRAKNKSQHARGGAKERQTAQELDHLRSLFEGLQQENSELRHEVGVLDNKAKAERKHRAKQQRSTRAQPQAQAQSPQATPREARDTQELPCSAPKPSSCAEQGTQTTECGPRPVAPRSRPKPVQDKESRPSKAQLVVRSRAIVDFRNAPDHEGRCLTPKLLTRLILQFYQDKIMADAVDDASGNPRATLAEFCFDQLINKYGLRKLANTHLMELIGTVRKYKQSSSRILIFGRLLGLFEPFPSCECACDFLLYTVHLMQETLGHLKITTDGRCTISLPVAVALLPSIFKLVPQESLEGTMRLIVSKAIFNDEENSLEHALVDLDDYLEVSMALWGASYSDRVRLISSTYEDMRGAATGVQNLVDFRTVLDRVGVECKDAKLSLALYNKCLQFDAADEFDDEDTISQDAFVAVAFEALNAQETSEWQETIATKLTTCLFENRNILTETWCAMDKEGNGTIDVAEFRMGVKQVCSQLTHGEVSELIKMVTLDTKRKINYLEFIRRFQPIFAATLRYELGLDWDERVVQAICDAVYAQHTALHHTFKLFDKSGDGKISTPEFGQALQKLGIHNVNEAACAAIVMLMDSDGDGEVSYEEFLRAFDIIDTQKGIKIL